MHQGLWEHLPYPIIGLSPMDGVTDQPFRNMAKKIGNPDIVMTEFTSAEGVSHNALRLLEDFFYDETQRPAIAQIFGKEPRAFYITAVILGYLGFDGIDINMGCPAKSVEQHGAGAALIRTPELAKEIFRSTQAGMTDWANGLTLDDIPELKEKTRHAVLARHTLLPDWAKVRRLLPVSIKTRIGYDLIVIQDWINHLLEVEPAAITVHGRTLKQLYGGQANWEAIAAAVQTAKGSGTKILGNGDITTIGQFYQNVVTSGVDGALIGRATFGDPWFLRDLLEFRSHHPTELAIIPKAHDTPRSMISWDERIETIIEHTKLYEETFPESNFMPMRKHLGWYVKGFPGASDLRSNLVRANSAAEVEQLLRKFPREDLS